MSEYGKLAYIPDYEGLYSIDSNGIITNLKTGAILRGNINSYGYRVVKLTKNGKGKDHKLHRLLATTFIPNPNNFRCVNHIDGDKLNNSLGNLEWVDHKTNNFHAREVLRVDFQAKPVIQRELNGKYIATWRSVTTAARILGVNATMIASCAKGLSQTAYNYKWEYRNDYIRDLLAL